MLIHYDVEQLPGYRSTLRRTSICRQSVCESQSGAETSPNFLKKIEPDLIKLAADLIN